jgi:hypothetical protein
MKKGLLRVRHLRRLLEERAGLELQARTAELRRLEAGAEKHRGMAAEARSEAMRGLLDPAVCNSWLGMADAEIFSRKRERIQAAAQKVSDEAAAFHERRMSRRIERQQADALVSEAGQREQQERSRREQQRVDDWFQSLPSSGSRRPG